jgi:hypothetical protein
VPGRHDLRRGPRLGTPWSPLKSGILSGKYRRGQDNKADRGPWVTSNLNERAFNVIDVLVRVAGEVEQSPSRVALAWVQGQKGVGSTIIGARSVKLSSAHIKALDEVSRPTLNFPAEFIGRAGSFMHAGLTVNGDSAPPSPFLPPDAKTY